MKYFGIHNHTMYSNIRLLDCINRPKALIDKAIELGLSGIAITDHECLAAHVEVNQYAEKLKETNPDFRIALGNEIYLTDTRENGQKYYHFLLIAKDAIGHKALRELSSTAWYGSYVDRKMERVPLLKSEMKEIMSKYKGHVIATTACMGGELSTLALEKYNLDSINQSSQHIAQKMLEFSMYCKDIFGDDFYIECAPSRFDDQVAVNNILMRFAKAVGIKMVVGTDAHYLTAADRPIHKAYLNSKEGDREVDSFYEFSHLMTSDEIFELLGLCYDKEDIENILNNTVEIQNKISHYSLFHKQSISEVEVKDYPKFELTDERKECSTLKSMFMSDNIQERYWVNQCFEALENKGINWRDNFEYVERLEEEADTKRIIGEKLETNMFAYPNTLQHYIDLFWECGSMVGAGRGSSCSGLNHYLLGITQLDPIKWNLPWFRYMNKERVELGDIDLDLCPSKRPIIIQKIKEERKPLFNKNIAQWAKDNLGCTLIATFGTEKTKSAIQTACRGYRSDEYPDGIDVDQAQYMSSLVPEERGFLWTINDVVYGNEEKGRKPVSTFLNEVNRYPGLLEIIQYIEGLVNKRSSHASGVILFDNDPFEFSAFMKTPKGEIITQYDLHNAEYMGLTKYDFLVTDVQDKLVSAIELMQKEEVIESDLTLREVYNKYFHPEVIPLDDQRLWDALSDGTVINTFQFDSLEGSKTAKKIRPQNILEMSTANGLMRLMGEEDEERPIEKYVRQKNDISIWYREMAREGLTPEEQEAIKPYFASDYGVPPDQESLMLMLMDKNICGFTLAEANSARKIVGKKQMNKIPELHQKVLDDAMSPALGKYIWKHGVGPQMGYSFSRIHALAYSFVGVQTLYIATNWSPIYWNTACLIVNSGSLEDNSEEELVDIYEPEAADLAEGITYTDLPDRSGKIRKTASTDYGKLAKAIGDIQAAGIKISLADINKSDFSFKPDVENNQILFGLKGLLNVNDDLVKDIIANRPYASPKDFLNRIKPKKQAMVSLIKGGAFDNMLDRKLCMGWYLWEICDKKKRLTLQNMSSLIKHNLIPSNLELSKRVFEFNRYLKAICKGDKTYYQLDNRAINFLIELEEEDLIEDGMLLNIKLWEKQVYQKYMDNIRDWLNRSQEETLKNLNSIIFKEDWDKYASGNISAWEMEVLCFYYHEHELAALDNQKYGFSKFSNIPVEPEVEKTFVARGGHEVKMYKLHKIYGTCIAKNKTKSTVTLLTTDGVVNVKFRKDYFALFDKQISERQSDGTKKVAEKSWFNRGNMIVVQGIRQGDDFVTKKYASSGGHQLYRIEKVFDDGSIRLIDHRYQGGIEDE